MKNNMNDMNVNPEYKANINDGSDYDCADTQIPNENENLGDPADEDLNPDEMDIDDECFDDEDIWYDDWSLEEPEPIYYPWSEPYVMAEYEYLTGGCTGDPEREFETVALYNA